MIRTMIATMALLSSTASVAQLGDIGGILGGALPNVASAGAGNAAGVLSYCVKNKLVNATSASSVLGKLTGKPGVKDSTGFQLGQTGTLKSDQGALPIASLKGKVKNKLCDMVLRHATTLL